MTNNGDLIRVTTKAGNVFTGRQMFLSARAVGIHNTVTKVKREVPMMRVRKIEKLQ